MIDVLSNKISGCVIWFYFTMFFVNIGKNPGNKVLSAVELTAYRKSETLVPLSCRGKCSHMKAVFGTLISSP